MDTGGSRARSAPVGSGPSAPRGHGWVGVHAAGLACLPGVDAGVRSTWTRVGRTALSGSSSARTGALHVDTGGVGPRFNPRTAEKYWVGRDPTRGSYQRRRRQRHTSRTQRAVQAPWRPPAMTFAPQSKTEE